MKSKNYGSKIDVLINTVPFMVIDPKKINSLNTNILLIELASKPGGIDEKYALSKDLKLIIARGIPGKEMPKAAGKYIKDVLDKLLN